QRSAAMIRLRRTSIGRIVDRMRDPVEAQQLRERFRFVLRHDAGLLKGARVADAAVVEAEEGLAEKRASRAVARAKLETEIEEEALLEEERKALADAVRTERVAAERLVRELVSASRRLEDEMTRIRGDAPAPEPARGGFRAQRGRLPWPAAGRVEVTFGKRVDPGSGVVLVSNGLDLRAPQSAEVRAVYEGRVVYAGPFEGFGRMVILSHPGGFFSLYAHLESFAVRVGHDVAQFQLLGFVGDTGSTKGAYLYFELRNGRTPVDPLRWLVND
ncbi:MAG: peptidoglycan DD-metalloendopeptidase family protein, partial [Myxococcota bacterium]